MKQLDDMLQGLSSEGSIELEGEFGLDSAKAREKMAKFQLEDPHFYVLEFVQAAHLLDATSIHFAIDADEMEVTFDGLQLSREELEELYSAAFARRTDRRKQALRHIALGMNAARGLSPARILVEVGGDTAGQGIRLTSRPEEDDVIEAVGDLEAGRTRIYLKENFRTRHFIEFFQSLQGETAEKTALRERAVYSHIPIFLDGDQISTGPVLPEGRFAIEYAFQAEHERGVVGFVPDTTRYSQITVLQHGVAVVKHMAPSSLVCAEIIVDSARLSKNLSQSAFVEDDAWRALIGKFLPLQLHAAIGAYIEEHWNDFAELSPTFRSSELDWMESVIASLSFEIEAARMRGLPLPVPTAALVEKLEAFYAVPLAHAASPENAARIVSIAEYKEMLDSRRVLAYSRKDYRELEASDFAPVVYGDRESTWWLARWLDIPHKDVSELLARRHTRQQNEERWKAQSKRPGWMLGMAVRSDFEHGGVTGAWGVDPDLFRSARTSHTASSGKFTVLKDGRMLSRRHAGHGFLRSIELVIVGDIEANELFDGPEIDTAMLTTFMVAASNFSQFCDALATNLQQHTLTDKERAYFLELIEMACNGELLDALLRFMGVTSVPLDEMTHAEREHIISLKKRGLLSLRFARDMDIEVVIGRLGALADLKLFVDMDGAYASLRELVGEIAQHGKLGLVDARDARALAEDWKVAEMEQRVFIGDFGVERNVLGFIIGAKRFRFMSDVIRRQAKASRFMALPTVPLELPASPPFIASHDLEHRENEGVIGLVECLSQAAPGANSEIRAIEPETRSSLTVHLLYKKRPLTTISIDVSMGHFVAVVDALDVNVKSSWDGVHEDASYKALKQSLRRRCVLLLEERVKELLARRESLTAAEELELWMYLWQYEVERFEGNRKEFIAARDLLLDAPLFPIHEDTPVEFEELPKCVAPRNKLYVVRRGHEVLERLLPSATHVRVVVIPDHEDALPWLERLLSGKSIGFVDVSHTSEARKEIEAARNAYMERKVLPLEVPAPEDEIICRRVIDAGPIHGEIGLLIDDNPTNSVSGVKIEVLFEQRRAQTISKMLTFGRFAARVVIDDLVMTPDYLGVTSGKALDKARNILRRHAYELFVERLEALVELGRVEDQAEREMLLQYLLRTHTRGLPAMRIERHIAELLEEVPLFELLDNRDGLEIALDEDEHRPYISLSELSSLIGERYVWIDSKMRRDRIPESIQAPVLLIPDMSRWRELAPLFHMIDLPDLGEHIRSMERAEELRVMREREVAEAARLAREARARKKPSFDVRPEKSPAPAPEPEIASVIIDESLAQKPSPAPPVEEPAPAPPPPDPYELFIEALAITMAETRGDRTDLLGDPILGRMVIVEALPGDVVAIADREGVKINGDHAVFRYAFENSDDPRAVAFLASSVYSAINFFYARITDSHEVLYQMMMTERVARGG